MIPEHDRGQPEPREQPRARERAEDTARAPQHEHNSDRCARRAVRMRDEDHRQRRADHVTLVPAAWSRLARRNGTAQMNRRPSRTSARRRRRSVGGAARGVRSAAIAPNETAYDVASATNGAEAARLATCSRASLRPTASAYRSGGTTRASADAFGRREEGRQRPVGERNDEQLPERERAERVRDGDARDRGRVETVADEHRRPPVPPVNERARDELEEWATR
jgi:hypothetical protein